MTTIAPDEIVPDPPSKRIDPPGSIVSEETTVSEIVSYEARCPVCDIAYGADTREDARAGAIGCCALSVSLRIA